MKYSASHADLDLEIRVLHKIEELAATYSDISLTASLVAQQVDSSAAAVRSILSRLAKRGYLEPRLIMVCRECEAEHDNGADKSGSPALRFCRTCGDEQQHEPIVVFDIADALRRESKTLPKTPRRRTLAPKLRLRLLGALVHRRPTTA